MTVLSRTCSILIKPLDTAGCIQLDNFTLLSMLVLWFVLTVCALFWWWYRAESQPEPPEYPGALPLFGHLHLIVGNHAKIWDILKKFSFHCLKNEGVTTLHFGTHKNYLITDPDDALTLSNECLEKHILYDFMKPFLDNGLLTATVPTWKMHRKLLNPTFNQQMINGYLEVFNKQAGRLVEIVASYAGQGPFDYIPFVNKICLETICKTTMNCDFADDKCIQNPYTEAVDKILDIVTRRFLEPWLFFDTFYKLSGLKAEYNKSKEILQKELKQVIQRKKLEFKEKLENLTGSLNEDERVTAAKGKTFLDVLLERNGTFTDEEIRMHIDTTIVSGYDTVATTLFYTTVLIGSYPRVQERLVEELQKIFNNTQRDVTKEDLSRLIYLDAVIKESLRYYPVAPAFARKIDKDVKLKNYTLRAGGNCIVSLFGIHRHQIWGADADEFRPERWLDRSTLPDSIKAFAAFSLGRRQCIGKTYALMTLKTSLIHFIRRYKVTSDHRKMVLKFEILLKPVSGHQITIEQR